MKKFLEYLKPYTKESILGPIGKLCEATLELIVPLVIASIIDNGISKGDTTHTVSMVALLILLGVLGLGFSVLAQYFSAKAAVGFVTSARHSLYSHIQTLSYSDLDRLGTSNMIALMTNDTSRVQSGINLALRLLLRSPFVVFGSMIMAFTIDAEAGGVFAITIPLLAIVIFGIMFITTPMHKRVQSGVDKILKRTRANLSGVRVIRAFGNEERELEFFTKENSVLTSEQKRTGRVSSLLNPLTYVIINLGVILLIYVGAIKVDTGTLTQGEVVALYNYTAQILVELIKLANMIISISKALASWSRIASVFEIKSSQVFGERVIGEGGECAIEFRGVSLKYAQSSDNSLENLNFKVLRGQTVGIIGGTGSGKTSLANLIPRFYDATEGEIVLDGIPVSNYSKEALAIKIGVVPQKATLISGTVRENLLFGSETTDDELWHALAIAQADGFIAEKGGLDIKVEAGGENFSGGQRQRLTIARALVRNPEILILDDCASALDFATDAALRSALKSASENTTTLIISQRAASVMNADNILVLDDGKIANTGTHDELLQSSVIYREIYESQFKGGSV
ncbi:MAG: ABC transporter ATP-binding protein [Clostridia bacterium]|nr:ABC transporter ATP-binding protein [Clostridia bacterium]